MPLIFRFRCHELDLDQKDYQSLGCQQSKYCGQHGGTFGLNEQ